MERRNAWLSYTEAEEKELEQVAKAYRNFLNVGKTERECVTQIIREARAAGRYDHNRIPAGRSIHNKNERIKSRR